MTNIVEALSDPTLFGDTFQPESWDTWRAVLSAAFALPMTREQTATFKRLSGGRQTPTERVRELVVIAGRRSGKNQVAAATVVYQATIGVALDGTLDRLSPGERGVVAVLAVDRRQARVAADYINGILESSPLLSRMVSKPGAEVIELTNRISIEVHTNSFRAIRGRTLVGAIFDECCFWRSDQTQNPDVEVYRAAVPALSTTGGLLMIISSPYSKRGLVWDKYRKSFGQDGDILVLQGATTDFNPTLPQRIIDDALRDDPEAAKSEWLGQFRDDIQSFIDRGMVERLVRDGPVELAPENRHTYFGFVDPAGGGGDEFGLCIGHKEGDRIIVDVLRARKGPPGAIVAEYSNLLREYRIRTVQGDRYAGQWPSQEFDRHEIRYQHADKSKSDLYIEALAAFRNERVELPADDRMLNQFATLERRTSASGKDSIDHAPGGHDDRANVVAGLVATMNARRRGLDFRPHIEFAI